MLVRHISRIALGASLLLITLVSLTGCQTTHQTLSQRCATAGVPTLDDNQCMMMRWVAFAQHSQVADESWRGVVIANLSDSSIRSQLARAVSLGWSSQSSRRKQAAVLYERVDGKIPDSLQQLVNLWQHDLNQRIHHMNALRSAHDSLSSSRNSQSARISKLEASNAELKRKLSEMANIEASMDHHRVN